MVLSLGMPAFLLGRLRVSLKGQPQTCTEFVKTPDLCGIA